jgi:hypothetical protein
MSRLPHPGLDLPSWPSLPVSNGTSDARPSPSRLSSPAAAPASGKPNNPCPDKPPSASSKSSPDGDPIMTAMIEKSPPWLVSMVFHMLLMIIMALIVFVHVRRDPVQIDAAAAAVPEKSSDADGAPEGVPTGSPDGDVAILTPDNLPPVDDPFAAPGKVEVRPGGHLLTSDIGAPEIGWALSGRQQGSSKRKALLGRIGGNDMTEAAVRRGLEWLARNQRSDGSWSLCGPYNSAAPKFNECEEAATAMALLAFQGDGNTHVEGKHQKSVARGWNWLLKQQDADGSFFQVGDLNNYRFYVQGQCTIAVCELYAMSNDTKCRAAAQRAVDYCLRSQSPEGGWRYNPNSDSDVSVTGWIVMALQSAKMAGLNVPPENLRNVERFLNSVALEGGSRYPYQKDGEARRSMTAEALLIRQYLGWRRDDQRLVNGVNWITSPQNLIDFHNNRDAYYWYYATQVTHHFGGDAWNRWNKVMARELPAQQVARGKEAGSWDPTRPTDDQWGAWAGRLYITCLSIFDLEVYYRHLPIYANVYAP